MPWRDTATFDGSRSRPTRSSPSPRAASDSSGGNGETLGLQHDVDALAHGNRPAINPRRHILPVARRYQQQWIIEHVNRLDDPCADDAAGLVDLHFDRAVVLAPAHGERERWLRQILTYRDDVGERQRRR